MPNRPANRLAAEESPYLRQHAHNPVDWYPWGEEAFARARAGQKPIFLSVGYSTCHWCHVMARESFEDEAVARLLNRDYVAVKVDREERPDVDRVYMAYVQAATGQGGWPMSVWLTPELKPFFGGTYFPPVEQWGRPGFAAILEAVARAWSDEREKVLAEGERVAAALGALASGATGAGPGAGASGDPAELAAAAGRAVERCQKSLADEFDPVHGGFGGAPKFPRAAVFNFLHRRRALAPAAADAAAGAEKMAAVTLLRMAEGGIHDHVGGGFHRYSVDTEWLVPHFEKMLYDQAQLARCYLDAWRAGGDARYAAVARDILDYVRRDLADPAGGFYSAEDADSGLPEDAEREPEPVRGHAGHAEGAFYLWTKDEVDRLLGADAARFCASFEVEANGNVPPARDPHGEFRGRNILRLRRAWPAEGPAGDRLHTDLERLREARARRPRPGRDDKILAAWNGLMISALARGAQALAERSYGDAAARAAEFLRQALYDARTGTLRRSFCSGRAGHAGFAEDYACVIEGLLDLYETTFEIRWLQWADDLQGKMDELFWDETGGGYFSSTGDDPAILARLKEDYDGAEPAPTSVAATNLLRLDGMLGGKGPAGAPRTEAAPGPAGAMNRRERAWRCLAAFRGRWESTPQALPQLLTALELAGAPPRTVVLAGRPEADDFRALAGVAYRRWRPRRVILAADGGEGQRWLAARQPYLGEMVPRNGRATAYVCENLACQAPTTEPAELDRLLEGVDPLRPPSPSPPP